MPELNLEKEITKFFLFEFSYLAFASNRQKDRGISIGLFFLNIGVANLVPSLILFVWNKPPLIVYQELLLIKLGVFAVLMIEQTLLYLES